MLSQKGALWLSPLRAALGFPRGTPTMAVCSHLHPPPRQSGAPSQSLWLFSRTCSTLVGSFSVVLREGGLEPLSARGEDQGPVAPSSRHQHPPLGPLQSGRAVPEGASRKHFLADFCWSLPQDRVHERPVGRAERGRSFFHFFLSW